MFEHGTDRAMEEERPQALPEGPATGPAIDRRPRPLGQLSAACQKRRWILGAVVVLILVLVFYYAWSLWGRSEAGSGRPEALAQRRQEALAQRGRGAGRKSPEGRPPAEAPTEAVTAGTDNGTDRPLGGAPRVARGFGAPSSRVNWARFGGDLSDGPGNGGAHDGAGGATRGGKSGTASSVVEGLRGDFEGMASLRAGSYGPDPAVAGLR